MAKYEITLAYNVPFYKTFTVEANGEDEAISRAVAEADEGVSFTPEWDGAHCGQERGTDGYVNEDYRLVDFVEIDPLAEVRDHIKRNSDAFDSV